MTDSTAIVDEPSIGQKVAAEVTGTFGLVLFGVGAAVLSRGDYAATGLAFGIAIIAFAYAFGRVSGGHFNPAVSFGAALGGRVPWSTAGIYAVSQIFGALLAGLVLFGVLHGIDGYSSEGAIGANGFDEHSAVGLALWAALLVEVVTTFVFVFVILGVTDERNESVIAFAPLTIGVTLTGIHFVSMNLTGTSVNPARSLGVAVFGGTDAIVQVWVFIVAPLVGAAVAGLLYPLVFGRGADPVPGSGLNFGGGRPQALPYGAPTPYEQQWNQQQDWNAPGAQQAPPQQWQQPQAPQQQWQQPPAPQQPQQPGQQQYWNQPQQPQQPEQQQWQQPQQPPQAGQPQQWGQPSPGDDEGHTQIRRND